MKKNILDTQLSKNKNKVVYKTKVSSDLLLLKYAIVGICTKGTNNNISFTQRDAFLRTYLFIIDLKNEVEVYIFDIVLF